MMSIHSLFHLYNKKGILLTINTSCIQIIMVHIYNEDISNTQFSHIKQFNVVGLSDIMMNNRTN